MQEKAISDGVKAARSLLSVAALSLETAAGDAEARLARCCKEKHSHGVMD